MAKKERSKPTDNSLDEGIEVHYFSHKGKPLKALPHDKARKPMLRAKKRGKL
jgi:hypothetical protein